jgi:hypothetical protein
MIYGQIGYSWGFGLELVNDKVRREKALDFSGCNSRPGTGSLHPVAIETAAEVTKPGGAFDVEGR